MRKGMKIFIPAVSVLVVVFCVFSKNTNLAAWDIKYINTHKSEISWSRFTWSNETLGGKFYEKASLSVPCKIAGLPYNFSFQFDLGAGKTGIYEKNLRSLFHLLPDLAHHLKRLKSPLLFWNSKKYYEALIISFGAYTATNKKAFLYNSYGDTFTVNSLNINDSFNLGTIGADLFQGKVLIIDYPNQQFAICDTVPEKFTTNLINIELDKDGRVILPYKSKGDLYKITFDNGSSLFPITARTVNRKKFSINPIIDSIEVSSWGEKHMFDSRLITDTFELAGKKFCNVKVYENPAKLSIAASGEFVAMSARCCQ